MCNQIRVSEITGFFVKNCSDKFSRNTSRLFHSIIAEGKKAIFEKHLFKMKTGYTATSTCNASTGLKR